MKIGPDSDAKTAISGSNASTIIVRGHDLAADLIGRISFTDHVWLLLTGDLPSQAQRAVLDATLVAIAEHGLVPSVQVSRMTLATAPEAFQGAVAAGLLGCGSVILGASQTAGHFIRQVLEEPAPSRQAAIGSVVGRYVAAGTAVPGFGHPLHKAGDPRALRLFAIAEQVGIAGQHMAVVREVEACLPELTRRRLVMNISAAIPAVLLDAGYPLLALKGVPLLARTASLIGHLLEEQTRPIGFRMSHAAASVVAYDGAAPDGFVPDEN